MATGVEESTDADTGTRPCEVCDDSVAARFCNECAQCFCESCHQVHSNIKLCKDHTYTNVAEKSEKVPEEKLVMQEIEKLREKIEGLKCTEVQHATTDKNLQLTQTQSKQTSQQLRAAVHEDVDKYFNVIDKRIDSFYQEELTAAAKRDVTLGKLDQLAEKLDNTLKLNEKIPLDEAKELQTEAQKLVTSSEAELDVAGITSRLSLERNPNWSLEGAVTVREKENRKLTALQRKWVLHAEARISKSVNAVRIINEQVWVCAEDAIVVLDQRDLRKLRTIQSDELGKIYDVASVRDGDIVIATDKGLYHAHLSGAVQSCIDPDDHTSVVAHRDHVYAATWIDPKSINTFAYENSSGRWLNVRSFNISLPGFITINISGKREHVTVTSGHRNKVLVYSLAGELQHEYDTSDSDENMFDWPIVCDVDDSGSVLISDSGNDRLQVMSAQGEFRVVELEPEAYAPHGAVLFSKQLYVGSSKAKEVYKYI